MAPATTVITMAGERPAGTDDKSSRKKSPKEALGCRPNPRHSLTGLPVVVHHYVGQWRNHQFDHLWGMLSLDMWHTDLLSPGTQSPVSGLGARLPGSGPGTRGELRDAPLTRSLFGEHTMATLRLHYQGSRRCTVFDLGAQPDGTLANEKLCLTVLEVDITERRVGGLFMFMGECPLVCGSRTSCVDGRGQYPRAPAHANSFQMTPDSMLHNLEE